MVPGKFITENDRMKGLNGQTLNIRIKTDILLNIAGMCIFGIICFTCTQLGMSDKIPEFMTILVLCPGSWYIIYFFRTKCRSDRLFGILLAGYLVRMVCLFLDLYGRRFVTILHSASDSEVFYSIAVEYYHNNYMNYSTRYPYVIQWVYDVFGQNRLIAQYVNIFFWFLTVLVVVRLCESSEVGERRRLIPYMVLAFWPNWVFLSGILLRESIQIFFDALSFYCFVGWMRTGKIRKTVAAFLLVLPALFLHMASVAVWAAYVVVLSVWSVRKQKMVFHFGKWLKLLFLCVLLVAICLATPLEGIVLSKLNNGFSFYGITHQIFGDGSSDYLREMDCRYWEQFIPYTVIRMFYFVFSPLPQDFRGVADAMAFLMDSLPIFILTGCMLRNMGWHKRQRGYVAAGLWVCIMLAGIFAWGTSNAGTAMRHRTVAVGVWVMAYCLSLGGKGAQWAGKKRGLSSVP